MQTSGTLPVLSDNQRKTIIEPVPRKPAKPKGKR